MKTVFIILSIAISFSVTAQTFSIGPTVGFGHSWIDHVNSYYSYSKYNRKFDPAWNAGISFLYNTKKHFALGIDVKYSAEGDKAHNPGFNGGDVISPAGIVIYHLNYIRVPVKFIYCFGKNNAVIRPKIYVGPDFGFFSDLQTVTKDDGGDTFKSTTNYAFKKFDFGAIAAAGLNIRISKKLFLNTDLQYYQGMKDILRDYSPANRITGYNGNIEINTALLIKL